MMCRCALAYPRTEMPVQLWLPQDLLHLLTDPLVVRDGVGPPRSPLDDNLLDAAVRLVRLVESPSAEARVLLPLVTREIVFRLLAGEQSARLEPAGFAVSARQPPMQRFPSYLLSVPERRAVPKEAY